MIPIDKMYKNEPVSILMPVYEEEKTVYKIIKRVLRQPMVDRLLIVYRKSKDRTLSEIKRAIAGSRKCEIIINPTNLGKGYSVRLALKRVGDGIVLIQDADEEYYPEDYGKLLAGVSANYPVFGYRNLNAGAAYRLGKAASNLHTILFNLLFNQKVKDFNVGYKLFKVDMLKGKELRQNGWELDAEIAVTLAKNGYTIKNVPIRYKGRTYEEGKKIGPRAAISMAMFIFASRFSG